MMRRVLSFVRLFSRCVLACFALAVGLWCTETPGALAQESRPSEYDDSDADVERVTFPEALARFRRVSPVLEEAGSRYDAASGRLRQTRAYGNPSLSLTHEPLYGNGRRASESYLNLEQELSWPGKRSARIEAAERRAEAVRTGAAADSILSVGTLVDAFVRAASRERELRALRRVDTLIAEVLRSGGARFEEGSVSGYELSRLRVERSRYETRLVRARIENARARRTLAALLYPSGRIRAVAPRLEWSELPDLAPLDTLVARAMDRHPRLRAARSRVQAADAQVAAARASRIPDLTLTAGYKRQSDRMEGLFLAVSVPLPLFDRAEGTIEAERAARRGAEADLRAARQAVRLQLSEAFARCRLLRARIEEIRTEAAPTASGVLGRADHILEAARVSYREDETTLVELLDAAQAYRDLQTQEAELLADFWRSYVELLRASARLNFSSSPFSSSAN